MLDGLRGESSIARAVPPGGYRRGTLLQLVEGVPGSRQSAGLAGDTARSATSRRGDGPSPRGAAAEGGWARAGARTSSAQKKHDRGWGSRAMRYSRLREAGDHSCPGRAIAPAGSARTLATLGILPMTFLPVVCAPCRQAGPRRWKTSRPGPGGCGTRSPEEVREQIVELALDRAGAVAAGVWRRASPDMKKYFVSEASVYSAAQGSRPDHQPGFHRRQGGRRVQGQDDGTEPAMADRLHLPAGDRLGWFYLSTILDDFSPLHHRLEAVHDDDRLRM